MVKTFKQFFSTSQTLDESFKPVVAPTAKELGIKAVGGFAHHPSVLEVIEAREKEKMKNKKECD